ncbi:D-inositol-3-phosphate glycosyltransferase [Tersicoccus solisilvae]|uniref:D-inositol-3-phosphate glycosyltransferase n=1 Tax=Tersicoccus solisilvae TaxID=1882339 RepID=A0ABQ1NYY4_9MICC|nr:glycosyltransferase [Tersicoccus solisilvae]GGC85814.1 D-inositol-3-phosphate glycosyltransferase [Tersicoccus solisilvae]
MTASARVGMVCLHTCPFEQPGAGDAGGMNVYVRQLARALVRRDWTVHITTIGTLGRREVEPGIVVDHVDVGPPRTKEALAAALPTVTERLLAHATDEVDLLHAHYWLSGVVGLGLAAARRVPLVHTMHTMALVKNAHRGPAQPPEPEQRVRAERRIAAEADRLLANGSSEAADLAHHYGADPDRVDVVAPGVDLTVFRPDGPVDGGGRPGGLRVVLAGRMQRHKGPQVLLHAVARLRAERPDIALDVRVIGAASGADLDLPALVASLGLGDVVRLEPPMPPRRLAAAFRAADVVVMPSAHESFGLVALEAQACGTPVIATDAGGLAEAVRDGETGILVPGREPADWADALARLHDDPAERAALATGAAVHARAFTWDSTAALTEDAYRRALSRG